MNFRKRISENGQNEFPVYDHIDDLIKETICDHSDGNVHCLNRNCISCGVEFLKLQPEENDISDDAPKVQWNKYEYVEINGKKGKQIRKLTLVNKETKPAEMFSYLKEILATFPSHQFRATWQNSQLKHLQQNLPQNNCMCVHDFSENYYCFEKDEIQSSYFQKNEVSLHVSVIYRHSILEVDGVGNSDEHPNIITEHLFLISPDLNHDHNFSQYAQLQVAESLRSINYECSRHVFKQNLVKENN
ncbi:hypothetical protein KUTeg_015462 [Tegillarca granosa]|uniref:Uncharacterized protein n=1 Tax=Tegillarca granosa TaxID=220873 RepID=A0ABQ9EVP8_TEGGR|nr:hypothetical protein KUTeg_015462 [Tegillarca granosa]